MDRTKNMTSIYRQLDQFPHNRESVITIGSFDGIHIGHQQIIKELKHHASANQLKTVLITFDPHPQEVIQKGPTTFELLSTVEEKIQILRSFNLDSIIFIPFTRSFSETPANQFIEETLINQVGFSKVIIGYDHGFGHNREGSIELLRKLSAIHGFSIHEVDALQSGATIISSTAVRKACKEGQMDVAAQMLGRFYSLNGMVIKGDRIGHKIGFPTANIHYDNPKKLVPKTGVYLVKMSVNGNKIPGMCNIGFRPTVDGKELRIEVHLFDFNDDIYGQSVCIHFLDYIREEKKFSGLNALTKQLELDKTTCHNRLKKFI